MPAARSATSSPAEYCLLRKDRLRADAGARARRLASPAPPTRAARERCRPREPGRPSTRPDCAAATSSWSRPSTRPCPVRTRSAWRRSCSRRGWWRCASPRPRLRLEAPAGVVAVTAGCREGKCGVGRADERPLLRRQARRRWRSRLGSLAVTSLSGGCGTRSPTPRRSASRSSRRRPATCRAWGTDP